MKKLLIILMLLLLVSCTWRREPLTRVERCSWTGQTETENREYPLGDQLTLLEVVGKRIMKCDSFVTYKNVRYNAVTNKKLDCPMTNKKCIEQSEEMFATRMAYEVPKGVRSILSRNPNIKIKNNTINYYENGELYAVADLVFNTPSTNQPKLSEFVKKPRCVNPDGSFKRDTENIQECLNN